MTTRDELLGTIWVCQCCLLVLANGECCPDDSHGGDSREPLSAIEPDEHVTLGMMREDHDSECDPSEQCAREVKSFSRSWCEGCESRLAGERHAATLWRIPRPVSLVKGSA